MLSKGRPKRPQPSSSPHSDPRDALRTASPVLFLYQKEARASFFYHQYLGISEAARPIPPE